ncbi:hypothetical protein [Actinokineospora fastidiosa]|uniref:Uncharacterized protein n=1 Tax=Actinokineospora fastidiosa TaxID=1816 RepID=A0A918L887_9PSEU|nr:hypothetical protein [Actinokineospora fastidiosa]GGS17697.1 hypothetical protein GCM10010171_07740 [Actinokineospora fastidiosa]
MILDDELRRLFNDDRLDVPVQPGATDAVLAGARRVRRRRTAAAVGGAMAVAVVIVGGVAFGAGRPESMVPATETTAPMTTTSQVAPSTTTAPTVDSTTAKATTGTAPTKSTGTSVVRQTGTKTAPPPAARVLGPDGLGALKLGMTYEQAMATGALVQDDPPVEGCGGYNLRSHPKENGFSVGITPELGVAAIFLTPQVRTPEGIRLGSPVEDFFTAYPAAEAQRDSYREHYQIVIPVPGNDRAIYHLVGTADGKVGSLALALRDHGCFG